MRNQGALTRRGFIGLAAGGAALGLGLPPALAQRRGGTLFAITNPEPAILVLGLSSQGPTQLIGGKIYNGLLDYDFDLKPLPSLAESWTVSPDGREYVFKLRPNATWHDGRPCTSEDVIFTTRDFLPEVHSRARQNFGRVAEFLAPDPHTVVFRLKEPFGPFLGAFQVGSAPITPKHVYAGTDFRKNPANATPIGTGPFRFVEWRSGSHIRLERFEQYWKPGQPYLDGIYFRIVPDAAARALALETGDVQLASQSDIELFDVPRLKAAPHLAMTTRGNEYFAPIGWLEINNRVKPLDDKRVRQALMHALDRNFIRDKIWFGLGKVATSPVCSTTRFHDPAVKKYEFDPRRAEALLDEAGLKRDGSGIRFTVKLLQSPYGGPWSRLAEYAKQAFAKVGINAVLEATDGGAFAQRVANWDYELTFNILLQFGDPALGVARSYISSGLMKGVMFSNTSGYVNPKVDDLFARAAVAPADAERQRLYSELQAILVDEVPVVWLIELEYPTIHDKRLHNVVTTSIGVYDSFDDVYFAS